MRVALAGLLFGACAGAKAPKNIYTLRVSEGVRAEDAQLRYVLTGKFGTFEGWRADAEDGEIVIRTERAGAAARSIKGVVYLPGCGFAVFADEDLSNGPREHPVLCERTSSAPVRGRFARPEQWKGLDVNVELRYLAPWVARELQLTGPPPDFLLATAPADRQGNFTVQAPQFGPPAVDGAFTLLLREVTSGDILGVLRGGPEGGLTPRARPPATAEFTLELQRR